VRPMVASLRSRHVPARPPMNECPRVCPTARTAGDCSSHTAMSVAPRGRQVQFPSVPTTASAALLLFPQSAV
jgi:hypothetical protein